MLVKAKYTLRWLFSFNSCSILLLSGDSHQIYQPLEECLCAGERQCLSGVWEGLQGQVKMKDGRDIRGSRGYIFPHEGKRAEVIIEDCELTDDGESSVICTRDTDTQKYVTSDNLSANFFKV